MLECDDFSKCYVSNQFIVIYEFFYLLVQGYDFVVLKVDVELGGIDQKFNLLMGCELQCVYGQEVQVILIMLLLEGLDGVKKMFKLLGNYIGIQEVLGVMYSKLVFIFDMLMWCYFELFSFCFLDEIDSFCKDVEVGVNLCDIKIKLVEEIVVCFYGEEVVVSVYKLVGNCLKDGELLEDLLEIELLFFEDMFVVFVFNKVGLVKNVVVVCDFLGVGSVKVDGQVVDCIFMLVLGEICVFQVGKKVFVCIMLKVE